MSNVLKSKRQPSQFDVFHYHYMLRREVTDLMLRNFGFSQEKFEKKLSKQFGGRPYESLTDLEKVAYDRQKEKEIAFMQWFIPDERKAITDCLRDIGGCIESANTIRPQYMAELIQRRLLQDEALGGYATLSKELEYTIETLPVDINKYTRFSDMIDDQVRRIKGWRSSDNRFKKIILDAEAPINPHVSPADTIG